MSLVPVVDIAKIGIVKDSTDLSLPVEAWSEGKNVAFIDGKIKRSLGYGKIYDPPEVPPYFVLHTFDADGESVLIYAGLDKVYAFMASAHSDITRSSGDYTGGADDRWNGGVLGGIPILNNGVDLPQFWAPVDSGTPLDDLTNWPATDRCKIMRPFKNFLFAADILKSSTRYSQMVKVSHPAAPGALPSTWDETDPTKDVREVELTDWLSGPIRDMVPLRDLMVIYKEGSTHGAQFIGGTQKWRFFPIFEQSGLLAMHCAVPFDEGSKHFLFTGEDLIVHNGQSIQRVGTKKIRSWLQNNISTTNYKRSFSYNDARNHSVWFCFCLEGSDWPNFAAVYNWIDGQITFKELPQVASIAAGLIQDVVSDTWDSDTETWDSDMTTWDTYRGKPFLRSPIAALPTDTVDGALAELSFTNQGDSVNYLAYVERTGLDLIGVDRYGNFQRDKTQKRLIKNIWLQASGQPFQVEVATQEEVDGPFTWSLPQTFTPGQSLKLDFELHSRLFGLRFSSNSNSYWEIDSYTIDIEPLGQF